MYWYKYIALFTALSSFTAIAESVFVFVPTENSAKAVQNTITQNCPALDITVFGRSKDFRKEVVKNRPDAVISLQTVVEALDAFSPILNGIKDDRQDDDYVLVSVDTQLQLAQIDKEKIGVIDILGRKPMSDYVSTLFGKKIKLKRVTKVEDLLPLLTFGSVAGLFIPQGLFKAIQAKSNLELVALPLDMKMGLLKIATSNVSANKQVIKCVNSFDTKLNAMLGMDEWVSL
jgi:hypothetical protein